jgi:hypothetical protein
MQVRFLGNLFAAAPDRNVRRRIGPNMDPGMVF